MIADALKSQIEALSRDERHELAAFLTRLELEAEESYWSRIRSRLADNTPENWIAADQL